MNPATLLREFKVHVQSLGLVAGNWLLALPVFSPLTTYYSPFTIDHSQLLFPQR